MQKYQQAKTRVPLQRLLGVCWFQGFFYPVFHPPFHTRLKCSIFDFGYLAQKNDRITVVLATISTAAFSCDTAVAWQLQPHNAWGRRPRYELLHKDALVMQSELFCARKDS